MRIALLFAAVLLMGGSPPRAEPVAKTGKSRSFFFTYAATVKNLAPGKRARIWIPVPADSAEQEVTVEARDLPTRGRYDRDAVYGNRIMYFEGKANKQGRIPLLLTYKVLRREITIGGSPSKAAPDKVKRFLQADTLVPVGGKPLELLKGIKVPQDPMAAARVLYDVVNRHMRYSKESTGWGRGDAVWACDSKFGNCTDFHSLFISLARSQGIPAKFEIGFALPPPAGAGLVDGYHCWAWFLPPGKNWVPVDISEANRNPAKAAYCFGNLTENRVTFSVGRDIMLAPKQDGPPLNYFIFPYVEVDGRPLPSQDLESVFSFQDVTTR